MSVRKQGVKRDIRMPPPSHAAVSGARAGGAAPSGDSGDTIR